MTGADLIVAHSFLSLYGLIIIGIVAYFIWIDRNP